SERQPSGPVPPALPEDRPSHALSWLLYHLLSQIMGIRPAALPPDVPYSFNPFGLRQKARSQAVNFIPILPRTGWAAQRPLRRTPFRLLLFFRAGAGVED